MPNLHLDSYKYENEWKHENNMYYICFILVNQFVVWQSLSVFDVDASNFRQSKQSFMLLMQMEI